MLRQLVSILTGVFLVVAPSIRANPAQAPVAPPAATVSADQPGSLNPATATQAWLDVMPASERERSDAYFEGGYWLLLWNFLIGSAILIFVLQLRISARLRDFAERMARPKTVQVIIYAIPFLLLLTILSFPLMVYQEFYREHQYAMATQTFGAWIGQESKELLVTLIAAAIALPIFYAVLRRAPRTWWIWGTIVATSLSIFGTFISPIYVEPLFNEYKALSDPTIRDPILTMARANEIPVKQVFVVDASRQTKRVSANVAGFFGTTRIALNDNLLNQCSLPEIRAVMAHEMGHYVLNHGGKLATYLGLLILVGFGLTRLLFDWATRKWGTRWGVRGIADPAGLPLLALILGSISFLATPLQNTIIRVTEREADAFAINTSREPDGMAAVALKLGAYRKMNPSAMEEFIFFDHPSGRARIRMAMDWKAARLTCGETADSPSR